MALGFKGDTARLRELVEGFKRMGRPGWNAKLMSVLAQDAVALTQECFEAGRDPYGKPWAKLTSRHGQPLRDRGLLMNSLHGRAAGTKGFRVKTSHPGAMLHNFGGTIVPKAAKALRFKVHGRWVYAKRVVVPKRQFFPDTGRTPKAWASTFEDSARAFFAREGVHAR